MIIATMSASAFRRNWRVNMLRVQSGEDISITYKGKVAAVMQSELDAAKRKLACEKLALLLQAKSKAADL